MDYKLSIPKEVRETVLTLEKKGFEAFVVGGSVRDLLLDKKPKDWDITTNATPDQIIELFPKTFYENNFGTVTIVNEETDNESLRHIEVTPYRIESDYTDNRHPDTVTFSQKIEDDLKRRDFTINAIAYNPTTHQLVDPFKGADDIKRALITAVGDPVERFNEDALRILRAIRLASQLRFSISSETMQAITETSKLLANVSRERVRDEFIKIINSKEPMMGLGIAEKLNVLEYISPVFKETIGVEQNKQAHKYTVWEHLLRSLQHAADEDFSTEIRIAALFHDIAKPQTQRRTKSGEYTYYGHEVVGARMARKALEDLRFPNDIVDIIEKLVRWHMFFADTDEITLSAVRRLVRNVGKDYIWDLMNLRVCDRIGTGRPKAHPYRLRKYQSMVDEVLRDPLSLSALKISGNDLMEIVGEQPGPKIGLVLHALLEEVLDDPQKNTVEILSDRAKELYTLPMDQLKELGKRGQDRLREEEEKQIAEIRKKHWVK